MVKWCSVLKVIGRNSTQNVFKMYSKCTQNDLSSTRLE